MPLSKNRLEQSESYQKLQPKKKNSKTQLIMALDLMGKKNIEIAQIVGITDVRVSIIKNTPFYKEEIDRRRKQLLDSVVDKTSTKIVEDPVRKLFEEKKAELAQEKINLALEGKSEFVRNSATSDVLRLLGYEPKKEKTTMRVEVTEKMANRFEEALRYDESKLVPRDNDRRTTISLTEEVS